MKEVTINEIAEDFYQIIDLLEINSNFNNKRINKNSKRLIESKINFYVKKYNLKKNTTKNMYNLFNKVNYNYKACTGIINNCLFKTIINKYINLLLEQYPELNETEINKIYSSCYMYIRSSKYKGWVKNEESVQKHLFYQYCNNPNKLENLNLNVLEENLNNDKLSNNYKTLLLLKNQKNIIKYLNDYGFINLLIYHEEKKDNCILVKENICNSFLTLNFNYTDTLALTIFWINKYIKFLVDVKLYKFNVERFYKMFDQNNFIDNQHYEELYCSLLGVDYNEYYKLQDYYEILNNLIIDLYKLKNKLINILINVCNNMCELDKINYTDEHLILYKNQKTNICSSFHFKEDEIDTKALLNFNKISDHTLRQSIPHKVKQKKYTFSRFEDFVEQKSNKFDCI